MCLAAVLSRQGHLLVMDDHCSKQSFVSSPAEEFRDTKASTFTGNQITEAIARVEARLAASERYRDVGDIPRLTSFSMWRSTSLPIEAGAGVPTLIPSARSGKWTLQWGSRKIHRKSTLRAVLAPTLLA